MAKVIQFPRPAWLTNEKVERAERADEEQVQRLQAYLAVQDAFAHEDDNGFNSSYGPVRIK